MILRGILLGCTVALASAQLESVFSVEELQRIDPQHVSRVQSAHKDSLKAAFHASTIMAWKPEAYSVQSKAVCASLSSKLRGASKLTEVSYGLQAWALMNCGKKAVPDSAVEAVQNAVTSKSVSKLYAAVMAAEALEKIGLPIDVDYKAIVKSVVKLQRSDGTFKPSSSKATGSALTAGMAYHVLAAAFEHVKAVSRL